MKKRTKKLALAKRTLDSRPDTVDFRDLMFVPTLVEVPVEIPLERYRKAGVPILDQGTEGACTGFGLAAVANYLLRIRAVVPDTVPVSPRMMYEMARRYDEWPGEDYEGSSARGAMKGWHKHGVCAESIWPYRKTPGRLTNERASDARGRPLGAYFRVNHKDVVAMHSALTEVGILYATSVVHQGWDDIGGDGVIPPTDKALGGHAFAIVAFDRRGFWIQNSWGDDWGKDGYALVTYDDWLAHGTDVWVARLGAPIDMRTKTGTASLNADIGTRTPAYSFHAIRQHIVSIGNNGLLQETGTYGTSAADVKSILENDFLKVSNNWQRKRLLLYMHGGLTGESSAIQKVADLREPLLDAEVYPLSFIWRTDFLTTLKNILADALSRRRSEGLLDATKDFMLERLDDALEPLARQLSGKAQWDEMKENGLRSTQVKRGGARLVCDLLARLVQQHEDVELHVVGFSAGSVFAAPLVQYLTTKGKISGGPMKGRAQSGLGVPVATCTLWAPACTVELFKEAYLPSIASEQVKKFAMFTLTDEVERDDDLANIYHKSLLYLVSNAFEDKARVPLIRDGVPILGMEKFIEQDADMLKLFKTRTSEWVRSPNTARKGSADHSTARHHGDFDDDMPTLQATLARVLAASTANLDVKMSRTAIGMRDLRQSIDDSVS